MLFVLNGIPGGTSAPTADPWTEPACRGSTRAGALGPHRPERIAARWPTPPAPCRAGGDPRENARNRLIVGRPDGDPMRRLDALAALLNPTAWRSPSPRRSVTPSGPSCSMNLIGGSLGVLTASAMKDVLDKPAVAGTAKARHVLSPPPQSGVRKCIWNRRDSVALSRKTVSVLRQDRLCKSNASCRSEERCSTAFNPALMRKAAAERRHAAIHRHG